MSQNQEIIEAKLCGYIDGELDPQERVEIEKHLEANPQHRRLLESLKATRDLLKWLPRESAPPEVAETLNGQLERSVLLDEGTDALRPGIWPRIFAAAAIVLLTAGLGIAVYLTLPKSQNSAVPYAANNPEPAAPTTNETRFDETLARREVDREAMKPAEASVSAKAAASTEERPELERLAVVAGQNRDAIVAVANGVNYSASPTNNAIQAPAANAMVMLVRCDSPQDTGKQLTTLMDAQKIEWKQAQAGTEALSQGLRQQTQMTLKAAPRQMASQMDSANDKALASRNLEQEQRGQTMPSATTQLAQQWQFGQSNSNFAFRGAATDMFVARMSRQQALQLTNAISQESAQKAELKEMETPALGAANSSPTTGPADERRLTVRAAMGGFAGVERGAGTPTTQPAADAALAKDSAPTTQPASNATGGETALDVVIVVQPNAGAAGAPAATQPTTQPAGETSAPQTQPASSNP